MNIGQANRFPVIRDSEKQSSAQGRLDIPYVFFFDFLRYALENQLSFPAEYPVFSFSIRQYLKEKERNRQRQRNQEKI